MEPSCHHDSVLIKPEPVKGLLACRCIGIGILHCRPGVPIHDTCRIGKAPLTVCILAPGTANHIFRKPISCADGYGSASSAGAGATSAAGTGATSAAGTGTTSAAGTGTTSAARTGTTSAAGTGTTSAAGAYCHVKEVYGLGNFQFIAFFITKARNCHLYRIS